MYCLHLRLRDTTKILATIVSNRSIQYIKDARLHPNYSDENVVSSLVVSKEAAVGWRLPQYEIRIWWKILNKATNDKS